MNTKPEPRNDKCATCKRPIECMNAGRCLKPRRGWAVDIGLGLFEKKPVCPDCHPARERSLWMEWVVVCAKKMSLAPPNGHEWGVLTKRWYHGKAPLESAYELKELRATQAEPATAGPPSDDTALFALIFELAQAGHISEVGVTGEAMMRIREALATKAASDQPAQAPAAPAEARYRMLTRKDTITTEDEFLADDAVTWSRDKGAIFVGMPYCPGVLLPARRALAAPQAAQPPGRRKPLTPIYIPQPLREDGTTMPRNPVSQEGQPVAPAARSGVPEGLGVAFGPGSAGSAPSPSDLALRAPILNADSREYDAAVEALRRALCALPRFSFLLDEKGNVRRTLDRCGHWIDWQSAHELFDPEVVDALLTKAPQPSDQGSGNG